ncbi:MAG TPA: DNA-directed RNA polymerase subunit D [Candidatus Nanoarchaeia archaeon]|nr:DNA-directed RNA polymerase subunit D [Candidatus Nanoarchaeia archaeon]
MEIINKKDNKIVFKEETNENLANAIRRYSHHIPIFAIDEVEISKNESALYDETLAHRIGLVPIKTNKSTKKEYEITLNAKGKGTVYSGDIKGDVELVHDKIPLDILEEGKQIELKGTVRSGRGKDHAKFSPGIIFYRKEAEIKMSKDFLEEVKRICPNSEIQEKGENIIIKDNKEREVADVCEGLAEKNNQKAEVIDKDNLILTVETFGQLSPEEIFKQSVETLKKDLQEVSKALK